MLPIGFHGPENIVERRKRFLAIHVFHRARFLADSVKMDPGETVLYPLVEVFFSDRERSIARQYPDSIGVIEERLADGVHEIAPVSARFEREFRLSTLHLAPTRKTKRKRRNK